MGEDLIDQGVSNVKCGVQSGYCIYMRLRAAPAKAAATVDALAAAPSVIRAAIDDPRRYLCGGSCDFHDLGRAEAHIIAAAASNKTPELAAKAAQAVRDAASSLRQLGSRWIPGVGAPLGRLRSIGPTRWESTAGLVYGEDPKFGNRVRHVLAHTAPNPAKLNHTVFSVPKNRVLALVDEAWSKRGSPEPDDLGAYVIPINRVVGTAGETAIRIVVRPGTNLILSAYPVPP